MIKLKIGKGVICRNLPEDAANKILDNLTFDNPVFKTAMKYGQYIPPNLKEKIKLFKQNKKGDIWIPRGYLYYLIRWIRKKRYKYQINDCTLILKKIDINFKGKLREYQIKAAKSMLEYSIGVLEAATGSGKTVMIIYIITVRKQPSLIIVHSKELLYQWEQRIKDFTGEECGLIGDGKFIVKPITVGIINTVKNSVPKLYDKFGFIIVDEVHKIAANSYMDTLQKFPAKFYLGATATNFRRDGLGHTIFASIGPKKHIVDKEMLYKTKAVLKPSVVRVNTNFYYDFTNDYSSMLKKLTENVSRNHLICTHIHLENTRKNGSMLIVSDRKKHLEAMQKGLSKQYRISSLLLTGATKSKDRKCIVKKLQSGECRVLFASLSLILEGYDLPALTSLFITTPIKYKGNLIQCVGRILRPKKGKKPTIYDFRDTKIPVLTWSGYARDKIYKSEWKIK